MTKTVNNFSPPSLYKSKLIKWYDTASVRTRPRRIFLKEDCTNKVFWVPELAPISQHPLILEKELSSKVLFYYLYLHLNFTIKLEQEVVNSVVGKISQRKIEFDVPEEMILDAFKIYCDEAYHSFSYADFKFQLETNLEVSVDFPKEPSFLRQLREIQNEFSDSSLFQLTEIFFVIISETLISTVLNKTPKDKRLINTVRQLISDHALDEAYHHAYFSNLLPIIWSQLRINQQEIIKQLIPQFILFFLEPDYHLLKLILMELNVNQGEIYTIIMESYPSAEVITGIEESARSTIILLNRNGILGKDDILEALRSNCKGFDLFMDKIL